MRCGLIEVRGKAFIIFRISLPSLPPSPVFVQTFDGTWLTDFLHFRASFCKLGKDVQLVCTALADCTKRRIGVHPLWSAFVAVSTDSPSTD